MNTENRAYVDANEMNETPEMRAALERIWDEDSAWERQCQRVMREQDSEQADDPSRAEVARVRMLLEQDQLQTPDMRKAVADYNDACTREEGERLRQQELAGDRADLHEPEARSPMPIGGE